MKRSNNHYPLLRAARLTLYNGLGDRGGLVFLEHPDEIVELPATGANMVVVLQKAWARTPGVPTRDRGFLNRRRLHEEYTTDFNIISVDSVSKYVPRLEASIERAFPHLDTPPALVERIDRKGTHLVRDVHIVDLGKKKSKAKRHKQRRQGAEPGAESAN